MFDEVGAVAGEHVDDGNLDHRVAGGLEAHRGASHIDQHLTGHKRGRFLFYVANQIIGSSFSIV